MQISFVERMQLTDDVWEYVFSPESPVEYVSGQYSRFTFPFHVDDTRGKQHRTFSLISHPSEPSIHFISRFDPPLSVFKQPLSELKPGDTMSIDEPHGDAILPRLATTPLIFVAQGIALASYAAMLKEIAHAKLAHPITLLWAKRSEDERLECLIPSKISFVKRHEFTYPDRLKVDHIIESDTPDSLIYLSGSQTFVETLGEALEASGTPRERIIYDYYSGYEDL